MITHKKTLASREIRVFLSSTFRDMDSERTYLLKQVFPRVRAACLQRQVGFSEIDLRWGVSEEEAKSGATVEICLKEIDRCRNFPPFFIGFLGERYGWVPVHEDLAAYWEKNKDSPYAPPIQQAIERGISVTELEMELAVLQPGAADKIEGHALFCLRDVALTDTLYAQALQTNPAVNELDFYDTGHGKLLPLKHRIRQSGFLVQDDYTNVEQFGQTVETYLLIQLDRYFPAAEVPTPQQRSNAEHAGFRFHRLTNFLPRPDVRAQMVDEIVRRSDLPALGPILLSGPSGQGKSALMADLAQHYQTQLATSWRVIDHYVGADSITTLDGWVERILQTLHPDIQDLTGDIPATQADKVKALSTWVAMAAQRHGCKYLFIIDALDQLSDGGKNLDMLRPEILGPDGIVIASAADGTAAIAAAALAWQTRIEVPPLTDKLRTQFVNNTLARYRKRLPTELAHQLASAAQSGSPLFLGLALEELRLDARHESLPARIEVILTQPDAQQLFLNSFLRDADYGRPEEPELAARFMALIGAARAGLSELELSDLLALPTDPIAQDTGKPRLPQIHLSRLLVSMSPFLLNKQGRRAPMHRIFGEAALRHQKVPAIRNHMYAHFATGYGLDNHAFEARAATEALFQIAELAKLDHSEQSQAKLVLIEDLGCLDTLVALHDDEDNQAGKLILYVLDLLKQEENERVSSKWQSTFEILDSDGVDDAASGIRQFGRWLEYWAHYQLAISVLKRLHSIQNVINTNNYISHASTSNALGSLYRNFGQYNLAKPLLEKALAFCQNLYGDNHPDTASSLGNLAILLNAMGDYKGAEQLYRQALNIDETLSGAEHQKTATSLNNLAELLRTIDDYTNAKPLYQRALAIREKVLGSVHPDTAMSLNNYALLLQSMGDYETAKPMHYRSLTIHEKVFGADHPTTSISINNLGLLFYSTGEFDIAEPLYRRALKIREKTLGVRHPKTATSLYNLACLLHTIKDYKTAEAMHRQALTITENIFGTEHPATAECLNGLACLLEETGDYADAEVLLRRSLFIEENIFCQNSPNIAMTLHNLAHIQELNERFDDSESLYRRSLIIFLSSHGDDHPSTVSAMGSFANILHLSGKIEESVHWYRKKLSILERMKGIDHEETLAELLLLALVLQINDRLTEAEPLQWEAVKRYVRAYGKDHLNVTNSYISLGDLLKKQEKYSEAKIYYEKALTIFEDKLEGGHDSINLVKTRLVQL